MLSTFLHTLWINLCQREYQISEQPKFYFSRKRCHGWKTWCEWKPRLLRPRTVTSEQRRGARRPLTRGWNLGGEDRLGLEVGRDGLGVRVRVLVWVGQRAAEGVGGDPRKAGDREAARGQEPEAEGVPLRGPASVGLVLAQPLQQAEVTPQEGGQR